MAEIDCSDLLGGKGPLLMGLTWGWAGIALLLVVARALAASRLFDRLRWDFLWACVTLLLGIASMSIVTAAVYHGLGNPAAMACPKQAVLAKELWWIAAPFNQFGLATARFAVVAFIWMIQGSAHKQWIWLLHFVWITSLIRAIVQTFGDYFPCWPIQKVWDSELPGHCDYVEAFAYFAQASGAVSALSDLILAIYPAVIFWHLQIDIRYRIGLIALMSGGLFCCALAILKVIAVDNVPKRSGEVTKYVAQLAIWTLLELWTILILGSVPPLRGLFITKLRKVKAMSSHSSSGRGTGPTVQEDSYRLQAISDQSNYCAHATPPVGKDWRRIDNGSSQEDILAPGRSRGAKEIYVTRDFVLESR